MAAQEPKKAQQRKPCPPGHHRMPDGTCMPNADMPARTTTPRRGAGSRTGRRSTGY